MAHHGIGGNQVYSKLVAATKMSQAATSHLFELVSHQVAFKVVPRKSIATNIHQIILHVSNSEE